MFSYYAAIVKNLRGVVALNLEEEGSWEKIKWLIRKFRYRNIGLPPAIVEKHRKSLEKYLRGNPFIELAYPTQELEKLPSLLASTTRIPIELAEALVLSSTYISPLLVASRVFMDVLSRIAVDKVLACREIDDNSWKLHLRIADYSVLDMYKERVFELLRAVENNSLDEDTVEEIMGKRRRDVARDKKRYWRITCDQGKPFLVYIDLLTTIVKNTSMREVIELIKRDKELIAGLAVVPAVNLCLI